MIARIGMSRLSEYISTVSMVFPCRTPLVILILLLPVDCHRADGIAVFQGFYVHTCPIPCLRGSSNFSDQVLIFHSQIYKQKKRIDFDMKSENV